jgi:hypothetical protein
MNGVPIRIKALGKNSQVWNVFFGIPISVKSLTVKKIDGGALLI